MKIKRKINVKRARIRQRNKPAKVAILSGFKEILSKNNFTNSLFCDIFIMRFAKEAFYGR